MSNRVLHIVYVGDDGVLSLRCGVGAIARNFILAFPDLAAHFETLGTELRLSVISIQHPATSIGLRPDLMEQTATTCRRYNGDLHLIKSLVAPEENYFQFDRWLQYNNRARYIIDAIAQREVGDIIVMANDTIFANTYSTADRVTNLWIPHSLLQVHQQSYVDSRERELWEQATFERIRSTKNSFIGYISPYVKGLLLNSFGVQPDKLVALQNGFFLPALRQSYTMGQQPLRRILQARGIPLDKKLILSFARADEYKGLDVSLRAIKTITATYPEYYGIIIASRFSKEAFINDLQSRLLRIAREDRGRGVSLFLGYEFDLPKQVLKYQNTRFLINTPLGDFCPLVPYEAQLLARGPLTVINSDLPCFQELFCDMQDGLLTRPNTDDVVDCFARIQNMPKKAVDAITSTGKHHASTNFDIVKNYVKGIENLL